MQVQMPDPRVKTRRRLRAWTARGCRGAAILVLIGGLGGCASTGNDLARGSGTPPDSSADIPDAVPRVEPRSKYGNPETYVVRGRRYHTKQDSDGHVERGLASWYGKAFHGRKTSSGERYNMYAMTAAHRTLPLPTYAKVTNMENGRSAVVRINDRGPFHGPRVIDLSYAAASKLGVVRSGTAMVEVRALDPARPASDPEPFITSNRPAPDTQSRMASAAAPRPRPAPRPAAIRARAAEAAVAAVEASPAPVQPTLAQVQSPTTEAPPEPEPKPAVQTDPARPGLYLQVGAFGDPANAERLRKRLTAQLAEGVKVQASASEGPTLYKVRVGPLGSEQEAAPLVAKLGSLGVTEPRRVWN